MEEHRIDRFVARYRAPAGVDARARLDGVIRDALPAALDTAIARLGVAEGEELCVKRVEAPLRIAMHTSSDEIAAAWSLAIADGLAEAIARQGGVVRYGSTAHALVDLVAGVAARDTSRAWAWRQLGLWRAGDEAGDARAIDEAIGALTAHPGLVAPVLAEAARAGVLATLATRVPARAWIALARAALSAARARIDLPAPEMPAIAANPATRREAERVAHASWIARALAPIAAVTQASRPRAEEGSAAAIAVLAVAEVEPATLRAEAAQAAVIALAAILASGDVGAEEERGDAARGSEARAPDRGVDSARSSTEARPTADTRSRSSAPPSADERRTPQRSARDASVEIDPVATSASSDRAADDAHASSGAIEPPIDTPRAEPRPLPEVRRRGATRVGGLLFLLHIVDELGVVDAILATPPLAARPLRWSLHLLGCTLAAAPADDAAVLAFAGLRPGDEPPSARGEHPTDAEREAASAIADRIAQRLAERIDAAPAPAASTLLRVCLRDAEIVADPGWFEVRLALSEVDTAVRRAGLDLDPGHVPWLGVVVRFVYG